MGIVSVQDSLFLPHPPSDFLTQLWMHTVIPFKWVDGVGRQRCDERISPRPAITSTPLSRSPSCPNLRCAYGQEECRSEAVTCLCEARRPRGSTPSLDRRAEFDSDCRPVPFISSCMPSARRRLPALRGREIPTQNHIYTSPTREDTPTVAPLEIP